MFPHLQSRKMCMYPYTQSLLCYCSWGAALSRLNHPSSRSICKAQLQCRKTPRSFQRATSRKLSAGQPPRALPPEAKVARLDVPRYYHRDGKAAPTVPGLARPLLPLRRKGERNDHHAACPEASVSPNEASASRSRAGGRAPAADPPTGAPRARRAAAASRAWGPRPRCPCHGSQARAQPGALVRPQERQTRTPGEEGQRQCPCSW